MAAHGGCTAILKPGKQLPFPIIAVEPGTISWMRLLRRLHAIGIEPIYVAAILIASTQQNTVS